MMRQHVCRWINESGRPVDASRALHEASHRRTTIDIPTGDNECTECLVFKIVRKTDELMVELVPTQENGVIVVTHRNTADPADIEVSIYTQG